MRSITFILVIALCSGANAGTITITASYSGDMDQETQFGTQGVGNGNRDVAAWEFTLPAGLPPVTAATFSIPTGTSLDGTPDTVQFFGIDPLAGNIHGGFYVGQQAEAWPGTPLFSLGSLLVQPGGDPAQLLNVPLDNNALEMINGALGYPNNLNWGVRGLFRLQAKSPDENTVLMGSFPATLTLTTIPEPGGITLAGLALAGALALVRLRKSNLRARA